MIFDIYSHKMPEVSFENSKAHGTNENARDRAKSYEISQERVKIPMPDELTKHSSSVIELDNSLSLVYFAGDREGAKNVKIYANYYDKSWSPSYVLLDRARLMKDSKELISRLGNPLLVKDAQKIYLFVVATSIGGWATSKIYQYQVLDFKNAKLKFLKSLHLSPFLNLSNLIRNKAISIKDGFLLPYYHESFKKYSMLAVFRDGKLGYSVLMNGQNGLLQPSLALDSSGCVATFRSATGDSNSYMQSCGKNSLDLGMVSKNNLKNFDSSQVLFSWDGAEYMIYTKPGKLNGLHVPRLKLLLAQKGEDGIFRDVITLASTQDNLGEVSYPSYEIDSKGRLNIFYTQDKERVDQVILDKSQFLKVPQK